MVDSCNHRWVVTTDGKLQCHFCGYVNPHLENVREVIWPKQWMTREEIIAKFGEDALNPPRVGDLKKS